MYEWRKMTIEQRHHVLRQCQRHLRPWHSPPHWGNRGRDWFHITAACYEHAPFIGLSPERMDSFSAALLELCETAAERLSAWCVLPNHYHIMVKTGHITGLLEAIGRLHGRMSYEWNGEEQRRGRKVFCRCVETGITTERHFWATMNYVHHNPVKHQYAERWQDWPWGSARAYLEAVGEEEARRVWLEYPINKFGDGWDDAAM